MSAARTARWIAAGTLLLSAWSGTSWAGPEARAAEKGQAAAGVEVLAGGRRVGDAGEVYKYVDDRGVVHLTNVPADRRFARYEVGSRSGGSGSGILVLARRERMIPGWQRKRAAPHIPGRYRPGTVRGYDALIARAARRHGVPAALVKAVVKAESNFQPYAVSQKGALGLMQLMPGTAEDLGVEDPFEADENVLAGTRYLRAMIDRYGDWEHALAAYNAGPGAVDRHNGIPPYAETRQYVDRVLQYYRRYDGEFSR